jgi:threonine aldolase
MRQVGVLAAAGLIALEKMPARLEEDHQNAKLLADLLNEAPQLDVDPQKVQTNILMVGVARTGLGSSQMVGHLKELGVLVSALDSVRMRLVTHHDVNRDQIHQAAETIKRVIAQKHA